MGKGLYKKENNELMYAQISVNYPDGTTLIVSKYENYKGEIHDGWYWFNTREEALSTLGVTETPSPIM